MKNIPFYLKAIFLFLSISVLTSCEFKSINEEVGVNEQEKFQAGKEEIVPPGDRG